jgi:nitrogen fixation-related uncharacterized protein
MTYTPLAVILALLFSGAALTLTVLFWSYQAGEFDHLKSGAYVIFDDDEPLGEPQDQLFHAPDADAGPSNANGGQAPSRSEASDAASSGP